MSGVRGGIRGEQVKDDSLTGQDINESTLVVPQAYHASGNHGNSHNVTYIAIPGRNGWSTTFTKAQMQLVAPYDGMVTKVFLRPTVGHVDEACFFQVRTCGDGQTCEGDGAAITVTTNTITADVDRGTTGVVFDSGETGDGPVPIPKGHAFCFALRKLEGDGYGITDATIIIEWDLST